MHPSLPPGWKTENNTLNRKFVFPDFMSAINFMNKISIICEGIDHHPDWRNLYTSLYATLTTHETGYTITQKDILLAEKMNTLFGEEKNT